VIGRRLGLRHIFCHGQKRDYFSRASQRVRGATKNQLSDSRPISKIYISTKVSKLMLELSELINLSRRWLSDNSREQDQIAHDITLQFTCY